MIFESQLSHFLPEIKQMTRILPVKKEDVRREAFLLEQEECLRMYYAPHNEFIHTHATVVLVGITPGWNQMKTAFESMIKSTEKNENKSDLLRHAKIRAGFSGQMRKNLCNMLDEIGLVEPFGLSSARDLFTERRDLLHTTSLIRYPVFYKEQNYTGHHPPIEQSRILKYYAFSVFPKELYQLHSRALIIPLGKAAEKVIRLIKIDNPALKHTYLFGFPHPSGANGHRKKQLQKNKKYLKKVVRNFITTGNNY